MIEVPGRALRVLLAAAALTASAGAWGVCVEPGGVGGTGIDGGTGGTGAPAASGGAGGTGAPAARGGVGGTGISPEPDSLGVVGVIEAFGSICVNGLEIEYDGATPVSVNGRPAASSDLAIGQVVAVEARAGAGGLKARRIAVVRAIEGPITRRDPGAQRLFVMGQPVRITGETARNSPALRLAALEAGTAVQVSGYRDASGDIVASRIDLAPAGGEHSAIGRFVRRDARGGDLDGLQVDLPESPAAAPGELLVRGTWDGARLRARSVSAAPSTRVLERVERAVIESLVRESAGPRGARVGAFDVRVGPRTRIEGARVLDVDQRVRVTGRARPGRAIEAERIEIRRPARETRERPRRGGDGRSDRGSRGGDERERPERLDNSGPGRAERPERAERPDNSGPGRAERPERLERSERPERPERLERPERIERPDDHSGPH